MATIRTFVIIGLAAVAGLMLTTAPGRTQSAGAPLKLTPLAYSAEGARHHRGKTRHFRHASRHHRSTHKVAQEQTKQQPEQNVITVPDGVNITSLLPWWSSNELQEIHYQDRAAANQVLSAADAWFAALGVDNPTVVENDYALASPNDMNEFDLAASGMPVADPNELNALDLAADAGSQDSPEHKSWLSIVLASLGGVLAVGSTARYLFI